MGLYNKLFGKKKSKAAPQPYQPRDRYNVMKNIRLESIEKHRNSAKYEDLGEGIYRDLSDEDAANCRMAISYELDSEDDQYPLEDVMDKYLIHVEDFLDDENSPNSPIIKKEMGGTLEGLKKAKEIIGKQVYNQDFLHEDGQIRVNLIIE